MQSDDLVAPDIVSRGEVGRNLDDPRVVIADQLVCGPSAGEGAVVGEADAGDLEEFQACLVDRGAVVVALGEHVDDGAVVGRGPSAPVDLDMVTGLNRGVATSIGCVLVADNIIIGIGVGAHETIVGITRSPDSH